MLGVRSARGEELPGVSQPVRQRAALHLPAVVEVALLVVLSALVAVLEVLYLPVHLGAVAVPLGALAAAVTNPVLVLAAGEGTTRTAVAGAPLAGWVLTVLLLTFGGPGGDVLVPNDWRALVLLALGVVPAALVLGGHLGRSALLRAQSAQ